MRPNDVVYGDPINVEFPTADLGGSIEDIKRSQTLDLSTSNQGCQCGRAQAGRRLSFAAPL